MKYIVFVAALLLIGCKSEPNISGKPASKWIEDLDDLNPQTQWKAAEQISMFADEATFDKASAKLESLAKTGNYTVALSLYTKKGKVLSECADIYAQYIPSSKDGMAALRKLSYSDPIAVQNALKKAIENYKDAEKDYNQGSIQEIREFGYELFPDTRPGPQLNLEGLKNFSLDAEQ